jgi:hypothetical protein
MQHHLIINLLSKVVSMTQVKRAGFLRRRRPTYGLVRTLLERGPTLLCNQVEYWHGLPGYLLYRELVPDRRADTLHEVAFSLEED